MSQRPPASRPASRSPPDGQRITLPPVQLRGEAQQAGRQVEILEGEEPDGRGFPSQPTQLPLYGQYGRPLQPASSGEDWRSGPSRDLGVHSMLNPTETEGTPPSRRVSVAGTDSPLSAVGPGSHFGASPSAAPVHTFPGQQSAAGAPSVQPSYGGTTLRGRPMLTPRSPRRSSSVGRGRGQASIDAARSPFLAGRRRTYTVEPGQSGSSDVPPMPTPPAQSQNQQHYGFPSAALTPQRTNKAMQAPLRTPHSESASPSISQSSQNISSSQTSPASYLYKSGPPPVSQGYFPGSTFTHAGGGIQLAAGLGGQTGTSLTTEGPYSAPPPPTQQQTHRGSTSSSTSLSASASVPGSRQTSASDPIQLMTITTLQGIYNVPVDVHQASRSADEKRARNAGASARFRQRRKEKEREANTTIEKMQSQNRDLERKVRELEQERDFYRGERDRYRDVMFRTPDMRHLAVQAPPSPQSIRTSSFQGSGMALSGPPPLPPAISQQGPMAFQQETPQERAPRRRRVGTSGDFASVTYTLPPASTLPPVPPPGYPPDSTSLPPLRIENTAAQQNPTTGPAIAPATASGPPPPPFDPYPKGPYERVWPSERERRR